MIPEIYARRSVRKFSAAPIAKEDIADIIQSGLKAPSAKNRQSWKYIVAQGRAKEEMLAVFRRGIAREEAAPLLPDNRQYIAGAKRTAAIMAEAPVTIFVVNTLGKSILAGLTPEERVYESCNIQSIGASIQNMLLTAAAKGIGSLWIGDIFFAHAELREWLACEGELVAAVAFGYPNEFPVERPRKKFEDVVEWRG